jgi:predicted PurR-regulated permease PerM
MPLDNSKLKQVVFLIALIGLGGFLFWMLKGFLSAFLGALIFYIVLRQPLFNLSARAKREWQKQLVIVALMFVSFLVLVLPVLLVSIMLSSKVSYLVSHYQDFLLIAREWSEKLQLYIGVDLLSPETIGKLTSLAADIMPQLLSATAGVFADIFVLYFLLYFLLANAKQLEIFVRENLPFNDRNDALLLTELKLQTISNAIGIPALAILQGITAFVGYLIIGVDEALFWALITAVMSVLPVVGTTLVWIPLSIAIYVGEEATQGVALFLFGLIVITNIDNLFRFVLQKKIGDTHPLITFFGVITGMTLFGFVGIIFGPLLISYFILLVKIYRNEYIEPTIISTPTLAENACNDSSDPLP